MFYLHSSNSCFYFIIQPDLYWKPFICLNMSKQQNNKINKYVCYKSSDLQFVYYCITLR